MSFFLILAVALALAMDAFAVSVGISLGPGKMTARQTLRLAFHFGFFQFMMPIIGWLAGRSIHHFIQDIDHWVAFGLLILIGSRMIYESFSRQARMERGDLTRGWALLLLSLATSIDAFAVGLSLAFIHVSILYPASVIGIVAFLLTVVGIKVSRYIGKMLGKRAELLGGFILILIGIKILLEHL